jgi:lysophospholipid acyltransferase (LPLAT)-like uncharacterized protein
MLKRLWSCCLRTCLPPLIAYSAKLALRLLVKTCKIEIKGLHTFIETASKSPCILTLWHDRLTLVAEILNAFAPQFFYTAVVSNSRDGEPLALFAKSYKGGNVLRVPHHSRHLALSQMIDCLNAQQNVVLVTPDGPRGPRYTAKPGVVFAARESSAKVIPFSWDADRKWLLKTWDKMIIPKPFSTIQIVFGESISFSKEQMNSLEDGMVFLEHSLHKLHS